jgi:hypothetical protein
MKNMKRYLVMSVLTPTEANVHDVPSNAGAVHIYIEGVSGYKMLQRGTGWHDYDFLNDWQIKEHGYKRESDAKRSYAYKNPQNDNSWRTTVQILTCEV